MINHFINEERLVKHWFTGYLILCACMASAEAAAVKVMWTAPTACSDGSPMTNCPLTGYEIQTGTSLTGTFAVLQGVGASTLELTLPNVAAGPRCYRYRANSAVGFGAFSDAVCITVPAPVPGAPGALPPQIVSLPAAPGTARLTWTAPTQNTDGSALTDLAGYRISYGVLAAALAQTIQVANPSISAYVVPNLAPGPWYFCIRAYTTGGVESDPSNVASRVVM